MVPLLEPMLATNHKLTGGHRWAIEPKLDGWRALIYVDGGVRVWTRRGRHRVATGTWPGLSGSAG